MSAPNAAERAKRGLPRLVRDLEELRVVTTRPMTTGMAAYPAGSTATIQCASGWTRISLRGDPCPCCGVRLIITRVDWRDVEVIGQ